MEITNEMIEYIAALAKLKLPGARAQELKRDLQCILNHIEILKELDLSGEEPLSHAFSNTNCFREDIVRPSMNRDELLANAPRQKDGCFQVLKTVE